MGRTSKAKRSAALKRKRRAYLRAGASIDDELTPLSRSAATQLMHASNSTSSASVFEDTPAGIRCIDVVRRPGAGREGRTVCEVLVMGSGKQDGHCVTLHSGQLYGCSRRARHRDSFWAVVNDDKLFEGYGPGAISFPTYHLLDDGCLGQPPSCEIAAGSSHMETRSQEVHDEVWRFLSEHREVAVVIDLVLSRPPVLALHDQYELKFGPTFATRPKFSCEYSSVLNAVVSLHGKAVGDAVIKYIETGKMIMSSKNLAQMSGRLREVGASLTKCEMRKCPRAAQKDLEEHGGFDFLDFSANGVWVVRLVASSLSNHVVVVDCDRRVILDGEEEYPVRLSGNNLRWCSGYLDKARIQEYRPVVKV